MGLTLSRRVWLVLGAAALLVIVLLYFNSRRLPPRVSVVTVERGGISSSITSNGKVEPVTVYSLRAKFDGFVGSVSAKEGQAVRPGQALLELNTGDLVAQLAEAGADLVSEEDDLHAAQAGGRPDQAARINGDLRVAEAQRDLLQRQQEALTKLVAGQAATPSELEQNRAQLGKAIAEVEQLRKAKEEFGNQVERDRERLTLLVERSQAQVASLKDKVNSARVTAPVDGTLFSLPVHAGDFVHTGDLLADLADLRQVRVRAYIDEPELGQLKPDQAVEVTWDALPDRVWKGRTEAVPKQVIARGARSVGEVLCSISNQPMELIPNTTVDVRIQLNERPNALVVQRGAVQIEGAHRYVYAVDGDRLHRREITVGISSATKLEVLSGAQAGDILSLQGDVPLKDNMVVRVANPE